MINLRECYLVSTFRLGLIFDSGGENSIANATIADWNSAVCEGHQFQKPLEGRRERVQFLAKLRLDVGLQCRNAESVASSVQLDLNLTVRDNGVIYSVLVGIEE